MTIGATTNELSPAECEEKGGVTNPYGGAEVDKKAVDERGRGVSACYKPGQFGSLLPHVARPGGRIHYEGEHASVWVGGWMQGALELGDRVAREVNCAV